MALVLPPSEENMARKFGLEAEGWQSAKGELLDILIETARERGFITYGECTARLQTLQAHPGSYAFTALLREVCGEQERLGHGMLCALVVQKATRRPGHGYWLGMDCADGDLDTCWQAECEFVWDYWNKASPVGEEIA
jgi:hypothetical protein